MEVSSEEQVQVQSLIWPSLLEERRRTAVDITGAIAPAVFARLVFASAAGAANGEHRAVCRSVASPVSPLGFTVGEATPRAVGE